MRTTGPSKWLDELQAELGLRRSEPEVQAVGQMQRDVFAHAAEPAVTPAGGGQSFLSSIPSFRDWLNTPEPAPAIKSLVSTLPASFEEWMTGGQQQPTPSGTPSAMPGQPPRPVDATIQDGRVTPPTSGGDWRSMPVQPTSGSHPEKQAIVYQEARAAGLDDEGARILVAVTETEGGLTGALGDQGQSRGPFQFYEGGQMPGFRAWVRQQGIQGDPNELVHDVRLATRYAASTYLGRAVAAGRAAGLSGADLATYVQQHGQVSVDPWKTGQNYQRLYGGGQGAPATVAAPVQQRQAPQSQAAPASAPAASRPGQYATAEENPNSAHYARPGAQKFRVRDEWGNEYQMTQEQMDKTPGGSSHLTVIGPVAMNAAAPSPVAASSSPGAGPAAPPSGVGSLPPAVVERWRRQFGRDPDAAEVQELLAEMTRFLA